MQELTTHRAPPRSRIAAFAVLSFTFSATGGLQAEEPTLPTARETALVQLLQKASPTAVDIIGTRMLEGGGGTSWVGAGVVIHPAGFVLTNDHVAGDGDLRVVNAEGQAFPARVVGRDRDVDLAVLRVDGDPWPSIPIGRSNDLMLGEPAIVIGNPVGLSHSVTRGVVSRVPARHDLQVSAAINGGNSGGPVLNAEGALIGIVKAKAGEGLGIAIPIDRVRDVFQRMMQNETEDGYRLGFSVDTSGPDPVVLSVDDDGPANGELLVGDRVRRIGTTEIADGISFYLLAGDRDPALPLDLTVDRADGSWEVRISPQQIEELPAVEVAKTGYGARYRVFQGSWSVVPDVSGLEPSGEGFTNALGHAPPGAPGDFFAIEYEALIEIKTAGAWTFFTSSDDGSRLWIDGRDVVDNDGLHADQERRGSVRLAAGLHSLRVLFFEGAGDEALSVSWQGPGQPKAVIGPGALLHAAR